uniref:MARVEL domain-containing protein n=1 Tax=Globodera rostochiensis TaxID=31243 RepID=A0A914H005_GLORO
MTFADYIDRDFFRAWPFGVLKTIHWFAPFATLITIGLSRYVYGSIDFVLFTAWNSFIISLITWICYIFRLNRKTFQFGASFVFVPFALIDFIVSVLAVLLFGISSLICAIALIHSLDYTISHTFSYLLTTTFCLISGSAFGYFAILVYRLIPNGQFRHLMTMVIEGRQITSLDGQGGGGPVSTGMPGRPPV